MFLNKRILSIDIFRGATIALMILVNNPGSWGSIYDPLKHADWHGVTPTDWVFPFFLFTVGLSIGIVSDRKNKLSNIAYLKKILVRTVLIFMIGLVLNHAPFIQWEDSTLQLKSFHNLRIMGVLQRIALCYLIVALVVRYLNIMWISILTAFLLILYWWMCEAFFLPNEFSDPYLLETYFGRSWDIYLFSENHLYHGEGVAFDPEGLSSTITASTNTFMGYIGYYYFKKIKGQRLHIFYALLILIATMIIVYYLFGQFMPLNKKIWTSSYALYTSALAAFVFLCLYLVYDVFALKHNYIVKGIGYYCKVMGMNALFIYALNGLLVRVLWLFRWQEVSLQQSTQMKQVTPWSYLYEYVIISFVDDKRMASFICAFIMLMLMWMITFVLYQRKIFIKV